MNFIIMPIRILSVMIVVYTICLVTACFGYKLLKEGTTLTHEFWKSAVGGVLLTIGFVSILFNTAYLKSDRYYADEGYNLEQLVIDKDLSAVEKDTDKPYVVRYQYLWVEDWQYCIPDTDNQEMAQYKSGV